MSWAGWLWLIIALIAIIVIVIWIWYLAAKNYKPVNNGQTSYATHSGIGYRGDMGNQLFQIATVIAAARRSGSNYFFDPSILELPVNKLFELDNLNYNELPVDRYIYEFSNYEEIQIPKDGKVYGIRGYRQCYKYFDDFGEHIRSIFKPRAYILEKLKPYLPAEYIAVHIRKGDYIKAMHSFTIFKEFKRCSDQYYIRSVEDIKKVHPNLPVIMCTDSPDLVGELLLKLNATLAPIVPEISGKYTDFCTLYNASALVISNSTYSWWAAYLRPGRLVIAPSPWWDPDGFIGGALGLSGPYLHYKEWHLNDPDTGEFVEGSGSRVIELEDNTPDIFKAIRGIIL